MGGGHHRCAQYRTNDEDRDGACCIRSLRSLSGSTVLHAVQYLDGAQPRGRAAAVAHGVGGVSVWGRCVARGPRPWCVERRRAWAAGAMASARRRDARSGLKPSRPAYGFRDELTIHALLSNLFSGSRRKLACCMNSFLPFGVDLCFLFIRGKF